MPYLPDRGHAFTTNSKPAVRGPPAGPSTTLHSATGLARAWGTEKASLAPSRFPGVDSNQVGDWGVFWGHSLSQEVARSHPYHVRKTGSRTATKGQEAKCAARLTNTYPRRVHQRKEAGLWIFTGDNHGLSEIRNPSQCATGTEKEKNTTTRLNPEFKHCLAGLVGSRGRQDRGLALLRAVHFSG